MMQEEEGAVAVIVAILLIVLVGVTAFVVDIGDVQWERRMLQNSADAAALAVAIDCAQGDCEDFDSTADSYAADNNFRGAHVASVVGPDGNPPTPPGGEVTVGTRTGDSGGEATLRQFFSGVLGQNDGLATGAAATAIWGSPGSLESVIPIMFSVCEYEHYAQPHADPSNLAPRPPYTPNPPNNYPDSSLEFGLLMRTPQWETTGIECDRGPAGQIASGGFSWLDADSGCRATTEVDSWFRGGTGNAPGENSCKAKFSEYRGSVVYLPIYSGAARNPDGTGEPTGSNAWYYIDSYVAFYLTGYSIPSVGTVNSISTSRQCTNIAPPTGPGGGVGSDPCISGYFTSGLIPASELPAGAIVPGDLDGTVTAVQLTE